MSNQGTASSYDAYRLERRRFMTSDDTIIATAIQQACGAPPREKTRITEGFSNEVYAVTTMTDQHVIVRIHWYATPYFEAEQWALRQCSQRGLKTPHILLVQNNLPGDIPRSLCVETRLEGMTLHTFIAMNPSAADQVQRLLQEAGGILAQVHAVRTSGFGRINGQGIADAPSWAAYIQHITSNETYCAAQNVGIAQVDVAEASTLLQQYSHLWAQFQPCLLHGDFSLQHLMVHQNHISGVIDFEFPESGDPAMDLAYWGYWDWFHGVSSFPVKWLLAGYHKHTPLDSTFRCRLLGCRLQLSLEKLMYHGIHDYDTPGMRTFLQASFQRDLELLRNWVP